jgi:hypothetical protein
VPSASLVNSSDPGSSTAVKARPVLGGELAGEAGGEPRVDAPGGVVLGLADPVVPAALGVGGGLVGPGLLGLAGPRLGELFEHGRGVAEQRQRGRAVEREGSRVGVDGDDRLVRLPQGLAAEQQVPVEPAADDEHHVGQGDADAPVQQAAEAAGVRVRDEAAGVAGGGDRDAGELDELAERVARA